MGLHQWGNPSITGALAVTGIAGVPDATIGVTNDDTEIRFAPIDSMVSTISSHTGVTQTGDDDIILLCAINKTIGGNLIDATRHGTSMQLESNFLTGGFRYSEWNWDWAYSDGAARDSSKDRRPLAARVRFDTQDSEVSVAGLFTVYNSVRDTEMFEVSTAGQLQYRGGLYATIRTNNVIQLETETPGSTWAPIQSTSADKLVVKWAATSASDGDSRLGDAFEEKCIISGATRSMRSFASGILNIGENHSGWAGINITVPTSGAGFSVYLATAQLIQVAFDGLYLAKTAGSKVSLYGGSPVAQHSSTGQTAGFTAGAGTAAKDDSTYTGGTGTKAYTVGDVVRALKLIGLMAAS